MKNPCFRRRPIPPADSDALSSAVFSAALLAFAAGFPALAKLTAVLFAGHVFWNLVREDAARRRLLCGLSLPLLQILSAGTTLVACWLALACVAAALRERSWLERTASLLTLVFPSLLLSASKAYLSWLTGY